MFSEKESPVLFGLGECNIVLLGITAKFAARLAAPEVDVNISFRSGGQAPVTAKSGLSTVMAFANCPKNV